MITKVKSGSSMSEKMLNKMNEQIKFEMESSYLYLSMAADLEAKGWEGMASWLKAQAKEEEKHAMKFYDHINERGYKVRLLGIGEPKHDWSSPIEAFTEAYEHEKFVSNLIADLYSLAKEENDYPSEMMLQWFVNEQVEEEDQTLKIVDKLNKIGDGKTGLFMLDAQLGKRED